MMCPVMANVVTPVVLVVESNGTDRSLVFNMDTRQQRWRSTPGEPWQAGPSFVWVDFRL